MRKITKCKCRILLLFLFLFIPTVMSASAQEFLLNLDFANVPLSKVLDEVGRQASLSVVYNTKDVNPDRVVSIKASREKLSTVMARLLKNSNASYSVKDKYLVLYTKENVAAPKAVQQVGKRQIKGMVTDETGEPLIGVSVLVQGTTMGTITDIDGMYSLEVPDNKASLEFTYIGYQKVILPVSSSSSFNVVMKEDAQQLSEVVVTAMGIERKEKSLTYATQKVSGDELMKVQDANFVNSLQGKVSGITITPSAGGAGGASKIVLRGNKSVLGNNSPLIVVDGIPLTNDINGQKDVQSGGSGLTYSSSSEGSDPLSMINPDDIESMNVLKGANAAALYGSKAANGVIVIETKRLTGNQQRITYNGSISLEMPDLTSYDLCNAFEKLEAERLDGVYTSSSANTQIQLDQLYNGRRKLALEGLDTYWLSKPLHTGIGHKHNLNIELGDSQNLRAILDLTYNQITGVMKGSDRRNISGDINLSYRHNKLLLKNILSIISNKSNESPYGEFSEYSRMNPYWQATDENGNIVQWVEQIGSTSTKVANPMYNSIIGTSFTSSYLQFTNNFYAEWQVDKNWKATARIGVSEKRNDMDDFYPASHSIFANVNDILKRGKYIMENGKSSSISGDLNINYNNQFGKHTIFGNAGAFISGEKSSAYRHTAEGFPNNQKADISFAKQYAENSTPTGYSTINREASFLLAASYDYDNRYLADATVRESASSLYGSDNRWANSWSFGIGWNLHNEAILKGVGWIKQLKLRASIGLTGNQNFDTNAAIATYNYYTGVVYGGLAGKFTGAYLASMPNSKLKWEQKKDHNIGIDMRVAGLSLSVDYYSADTKNMLTDVTIPTSTGFAIVKDNLGLVRNSGVEAKANYTIWQGKEGFVNVYGTFAYNRNKIIRLSESMRAYNEKMMKQAEDNNTSAPVLMYQDGLSMKTIWAVPSAGIDPQTGQEIYIKKDGTYTYTYSANDMVAAGNSDPKYRGTGGFTAEYKGIGLSATISYLAGCQMYNSTLVSRVENANIAYNVDRRLLIGRWTTPGQVTPYKKFNSETTTRATTRFVQDRRELSLSSISAYYEFPSSIYRKLSMQRLRLSFYLNDIATFSSIKIERGLNYPFARNMSFSLTATL